MKSYKNALNTSLPRFFDDQMTGKSLAAALVGDEGVDGDWSPPVGRVNEQTIEGETHDHDI